MGLTQILFGVAFIILGTFALGAASSAPWLPTRKREREAVVAALASVFVARPNAVVYDLGCGDGVMLFSLADAFPGIRAIGYEIALPPLIAGWIRSALGGAKYRGVHLYWRDFFGQDLSDADVVFVFSTPRMHEKVLAFLSRTLRDDALVIVEAWPLPGVAHERKIGGGDGVLSLYVYSGKALHAAQNPN
jgi:hypothetical protein